MFHSVIMSLSIAMCTLELCKHQNYVKLHSVIYHIIIILLLKSTKIFTLGQEHGKPYAALFYFFAK